MVGTPSTKSTSSFKRLASKFGVKGRTERAPYLGMSSSVVETPKPAPRQDNPRQREVAPHEGKAEAKGADTSNEEADRHAEAEQLKEVITATTVATNTPPQQQRDSTNTVATKQEKQKQVINSISVTGNYSSLVAHEQTNAFDRYVTGAYSFYAPNCLSLCATLFEMERAMETNVYMEWSQKKFLALPCRIYYSVLYYVRILSVKEMASANEPSISTWLRKFLREFPMESLPIAGPLEAFFANLAAYDPMSDQLTLLIPSLPDNLGERMRAVTGDNYSWSMTQPNTAALFDIMKIYAKNRPTNANNNLDDNYVPFKMSAAAGTRRLGGVPIPQNADTELVRFLMANPMLDVATPDAYLRYSEHHRRWSASKFGMSQPENSTAATRLNTIPEFMRLDGSMLWFSECISMATEQAKFFSGTTNLKKLDWIGTPAVGIETTLKVNTVSTPRIANAATWFPRLFEEYRGELRVWEDGINIVPKLIAKHTTTNARIRINYTDEDAAAQHIDCLQDATHVRNGPWYNADDTGASLNHPLLTVVEDTRDDIPLLDRRDQYIHQHFYLAEGGKV